MLSVIVYFLICFGLSALSWALHWSAQAQVLVLLMGLSVFPLQKYLHKAPIRELGFRLCTLEQLARGIFLPLVILGFIALADLLLGAAHLVPWSDVKNPFTGSPVDGAWSLAELLLLNAGILFLLEFVTEELMFRGYLLGKLAARGEIRGLVLASLVFGAWHLPIAIWGAGFDPARTPLYIVNMTLLAAVLGLLFLESRSLIPVAAFHALWNTVEYNLFGFLDQKAILTGPSRVVFDPEEGCIGTVVLVGVAAALWARRYRAGRKVAPNEEKARAPA